MWLLFLTQLALGGAVETSGPPRHITVYYATNREWADDGLKSGFNARDAEALTWGTVEVSEHGLRLIGTDKTLVPDIPTRLPQTETLDAIAGRGLPVVLVIHGYNTTWTWAAREAAQLGMDLEDQGITVVPVLYSWPSGGLMRYPADENSANRSVVRFTQVLNDVVERLPDGQVNLVAHSMGARVVSSAIHEIWDTNAQRPEHQLGNIILASADIDALEFKERYMLNLLASSQRTTLYVTSNDRALSISERLHGGYLRLGQSGMGQPPERLEVVDTGPLDRGATRHSTFRESPDALADLAKVLRGDSCTSRGLIQNENSWTFSVAVPTNKKTATPP